MNSRISACPGCGARNRIPAVAAGLPRCAKCRASLPWIVEAASVGGSVGAVVRPV